MRKITAVLVMLVAVLTISAYAAAKSYQFTGVVKTVQGDTFTVQKSATETWEFSKDASTKGDVQSWRQGDRPLQDDCD